MSPVRDHEEAVAAAVVQLLSGRAFLKPARLEERLAAITDLGPVEVYAALKGLARRDLITGISSNGSPVAQVKWRGALPPPSEGQVLMEQAIRETGNCFSEEQQRILAGNYALFEGLCLSDRVALLRGLYTFHQDDRSMDPWVRSAAHLLGSSKAAARLGRLLSRLAIVCDPHANEYYAIAAGSRAPTAVVLIENPRVFSAFRRTRHVDTCLGVLAYGYGLTVERLFERVAEGRVVACAADGPPVDLTTLMDHTPWLFWGDLDLEGLRIFESLRRHLPSLELSEAYVAMDELLNQPDGSHPYHELFDKLGQKPPRGDTPEVAYLMARCATRAVDQEALVPKLNEIPMGGAYRIVKQT